MKILLDEWKRNLRTFISSDEEIDPRRLECIILLPHQQEEYKYYFIKVIPKIETGTPFH